MPRCFIILIEVFFEKISQHKYDAIELNAETLPWATPHLHDKTTNNELEKITYLSKKYNLEISSIGAHIDISQKDHENRKKNKLIKLTNHLYLISALIFLCKASSHLSPLSKSFCLL